MLYRQQLCALGVVFRNPCRSCVTPPSDTDVSLELHDSFLIPGTIGPKPSLERNHGHTLFGSSIGN